MPGPGNKSSKKKKTNNTNTVNSSTQTATTDDVFPKPSYTASELLKYIEVAQEDSWEEGNRAGLASAAGHGDGLCVPIKLYWAASLQQEMTTTVTTDTATQTVPHDELPHPSTATLQPTMTSFRHTATSPLPTMPTSTTISAYEFRSFLEKATYENMAEFCNWASTTSDGANLKLLWTRAIEEGKKLGIEEGKRLAHVEGEDERMKNLGREEGYFMAKEGFERALKRGKAKTTTRTESSTKTTTSADAVTKTASCDEPPRPLRDAGTSTEAVHQPSTACVDTHTQTSTLTADAVTQTATCDEPPRPLRDAGTSTGNAPQPSESTSHPSSALSPSPSPATSRSSTPSTTLTTITTSSPPAEQPPTPRKRQHTRPSQPTDLQQALQPPVSRPEPTTATATSQPTAVTNPAATASETTTWASSSTQTTADTSETAAHAPDRPQGRCATQKMPLCEVVRTRSSERVVHSTEQPCLPHHRQRRSRSPPPPSCHPQLTPRAPVLPPEPMTTPHASRRAATSSTRASTTTASPPAQLPSGPRAAAPEPLEPPQALPRPFNLPKNPPKRAAPVPSESYTPAKSPTMPSTPVDTPCSLSTPPLTPADPCSTLLDPKRAVLPPPARFDWADDAASLPTAPSTLPRDLSGLRSNLPGPFRSLRRRVRRYNTVRRRVLPHFFTPLQQSLLLPDIHPSYSQPFITRRHPSGIGPGKPIITVPSGTTAPAPTPVPLVLKLDWDQDPRLVNLSQALCALGWIPPC